MISVVMPVFNAESSLPTTLASLAGQTHLDWELVAIDDGSTDGSLTLLKAFAAEHPTRVSVIEQDHQGRSSARNAGLARVRGEFIALLDADDVWLTGKLEQQHTWLVTHPDFIGCTCRYAVLDVASGAVSRDIDFDWSEPSMLRWATLEGFGPGLCSTLLVRTEALRKSGGFDTALDVGEDVDLALRLAAIGSLGLIPESLMRYRRFINRAPQNLDASTLRIEHFLGVEPFRSEPTLRRRLRSNHQVFLAVQALRRGATMLTMRHVVRALAISPIGPFRLLEARVRHTWRVSGIRLGASLDAITRAS